MCQYDIPLSHVAGVNRLHFYSSQSRSAHVKGKIDGTAMNFIINMLLLPLNNENRTTDLGEYIADVGIDKSENGVDEISCHLKHVWHRAQRGNQVKFARKLSDNVSTCV